MVLRSRDLVKRLRTRVDTPFDDHCAFEMQPPSYQGFTAHLTRRHDGPLASLYGTKSCATRAMSSIVPSSLATFAAWALAHKLYLDDLVSVLDGIVGTVKPTVLTSVTQVCSGPPFCT